MSEILRPQYYDSFNSFSKTTQSSSTPYSERLTSLLRDRDEYGTPERKFGNSTASTQNLRFNYNTAGSTTPVRPLTRFTPTSSSSSDRKIWEQPAKVAFLPPKSMRYQNSKTLVLDMDETLVHASGVPIAKPDCVIKLSDGVKFYILKRPYVDEFLQKLSKIYELVIYTSGEKEYATTLINEIDPERYISFILHRDHCLHTRTGLDKDLSLIGRDLKDVIFIDNLEENMQRQRENGIKISDFYSNQNDTELKKLLPFLEYAADFEDVRPIRKHHADFLSNNLRNSSPTRKPAREPSSAQRTPVARKPSLYEFEDQKSTPVKNTLNQTMQNFSYKTPSPDNFSTPTVQRKTTPKTEAKLSTSQFISPLKESLKDTFLGRFEDKMNNLKNGKPVYNNGDYNNPFISASLVDFEADNRQKATRALMEKSAKMWESSLEPNMDCRTPLSKKQEVSYDSENSLRDFSDTITVPPAKPAGSYDRSPLLEDLYQRINALEMKLKTKGFRNF